jgi:RNA polymerase sigma-70 factor (ECF subfamily)
MTPPIEPTDEALIRRAILQPDSNAFEQLIQRHQGRLRLYLRSLTGVQAIADELAQESLIKAHRSLTQFKFQSSFKTWLMHIARNTFLDHVRRTPHIAEFLEQSGEGLLNEAQEPSTASSEHHAMLAIDIDRSLQVLSAAEREVIAHCYFADLSMDETAKLLDMPLGTVKTHSQRGLKKLRHVLSAWQSPTSVKESK